MKIRIAVLDCFDSIVLCGRDYNIEKSDWFYKLKTVDSEYQFTIYRITIDSDIRITYRWKSTVRLSAFGIDELKTKGIYRALEFLQR